MIPRLSLALLLLPATLYAEAGRTAASALLLRPLSVRANAMGEAFVAADGGIDSFGYNPAGLTATQRPSLQSLYTPGVVEDRFSFTSYAHPLPFGVLSVGGMYYDAGDLHLQFSDGTHRNVKAEQDMAGILGLSLPLPLGLSAGASAKVFRVELAETAKATGYAFDVGGVWRSPLKGLNLGAAVNNAGPDLKFEEQGDPLPTAFRFGAAYSLNLESALATRESILALSRFLFCVDAVKVREERLSPRAGVEMSAPLLDRGHAALRLGHLFASSPDSFTFGIGLKERRFVFDYAFGVKRELSNVHHFSIGVVF